MGDSSDPWGIPIFVSYDFDVYPSKVIVVSLPFRKLAIHLTVLSSILRLRRLYSSLACETLSYAPETSSSRRLATVSSGKRSIQIIKAEATLASAIPR